VGPILSTPAAAVDDANNLWIYFATGRFFSNNDKSTKDMQHAIGVKDCIITGGCTDQTVERNNLLNVSSVVVCSVCSGNQVTGITGITEFAGNTGTSLVGAMISKDGWFTTLPTLGERSLSGGRVLGGSIFFTTYIPTDDICAASGGGNLYALYYQTGTAYKESVIGTTVSGADTLVNRSIGLDFGLPSQMSVQIGAQGSGAAGSSSNAGSIGRVTGFIQSSSGVMSQLGIKPVFALWSRMVSWRDL
jgi:type IV pilus assembly protein PilY1